MVRRTRRWRAPKDQYDLLDLFADEVKKIARTSALLMAYRASTGLLLQANRLPVAKERLEQIGQRCRDALLQTGRDDLMTAMEIAARQARLAYAGDWWTETLRNGAPDIMGPGDEYFSWATVRAAVEGMREPVADRVG